MPCVTDAVADKPQPRAGSEAASDASAWTRGSLASDAEFGTGFTPSSGRAHRSAGRRYGAADSATDVGSASAALRAPVAPNLPPPPPAIALGLERLAAVTSTLPPRRSAIVDLLDDDDDDDVIASIAPSAYERVISAIGNADGVQTARLASECKFYTCESLSPRCVVLLRVQLADRYR